MIKLHNYRKKYGSHTVIAIKEWEFKKGIYWIKGVNGSGKTTLLKSIAGIIPFEGKIEINEYDGYTNAMEYRRLVGFSEAEPFFPEYLTADELINYFKFIRKADIQEVENLCSMLGMDQFIHMQCGGYSAGMIKKLSVCLAFIGQPEWILLDEPFAFIDEQTEKMLIKLIMNYAQLGTGFILTSHHMAPFDELQINKMLLIEGNELKDES